MIAVILACGCLGEPCGGAGFPARMPAAVVDEQRPVDREPAGAGAQGFREQRQLLHRLEQLNASGQ